MFFRKWCYGAGAMAILLAVSTGAFAVPLTFSLDESSSQLTVQGAFAGFETVAHNTSVTSSVSGSLMIDVPLKSWVLWGNGFFEWGFNNLLGL